MSKRVLVIGGRSLLASYLRSDSNVDFLKQSSSTVDITSFRSIVDAFDNLHLSKKDVVLNCAAWTNVALAEVPENYSKVRAINVEGPRNLAEACKHYGASLIHISTDYVYDGISSDNKTGYSHVLHKSHENPLNAYGKSKLDGEREIANIMRDDDYTIVRTSGLFGEDCRKKTFLHRFLKKALTKEEEKIDVFEDQRSSFTYAKDLAAWLKHYVSLTDYEKHFFNVKTENVANVVNVPSDSSLNTTFGFAKKFLEEMGMSALVKKLSPIQFPENCRCLDGITRPKDALLHPDIALRSTEEALKDFSLCNYRELISSTKASISLENKHLELNLDI